MSILIIQFSFDIIGADKSRNHIFRYIWKDLLTTNLCKIKNYVIVSKYF